MEHHVENTCASGDLNGPDSAGVNYLKTPPLPENCIRAVLICQKHLESVFTFLEEIYSLPDPDEAIERSITRLVSQIAPLVGPPAPAVQRSLESADAKKALLALEGYSQSHKEEAAIKSLGEAAAILEKDFLPEGSGIDRRKAALIRAIGKASAVSGDMAFIQGILLQNSCDAIEKVLIEVFSAAEEPQTDALRRICLRSNNSETVTAGIMALCGNQEAVPVVLDILSTKKELAVNHRNNELEAHYRDLLASTAETLSLAKGRHAPLLFRFFTDEAMSSDYPFDLRRRCLHAALNASRSGLSDGSGQQELERLIYTVRGDSRLNQELGGVVDLFFPACRNFS